MTKHLFFGYGSLVNRTTHEYLEGRTARLHGWRRVWRHTQIREEAFLTAVPSPGTTIEGLVARVPGGDWQALDARETGYDRVQSGDVEIAGERLADVAVYSIPENRHPAPADMRPLLLSYVDVVVQGFAREFGPAGVTRFFETTDGWDAPVIDDRAAPRYPRHRRLSAEETALVDRHLAEREVRFIDG
ncbi:gamma-glutamylcyclotransferase family protein [Oceaniglobus roseus]|uniref:gamma-glutamylcyclotransferase family protein n=1 Tax=Oceaniglobus roseus TaxID=1737570 RepID=UPI000C7F3BFB|nr:gamma-glutamylcyclotransferase family protein [Kandeliimicrobium roseum]